MTKKRESDTVTLYRSDTLTHFILCTVTLYCLSTVTLHTGATVHNEKLPLQSVSPDYRSLPQNAPDYRTSDYGTSIYDVTTATNQTLRCQHGKVRERQCECYPCWEGDDCNTYVDNYSPRFLIHKATAVVPNNVTGSIYRAWASDDDLGLTCPLGPGEAARCPCAEITYQLFSKAGDQRFILHPSTGVLHRRPNASLKKGKTYKYKLMVQSTVIQGYSKERLYDILNLDIYVGPPTIRSTPWIY